MTPRICCLEVSHKTAQLALRERLAGQAWGAALAKSARGLLHEHVVLTTCGRYELYGIATSGNSVWHTFANASPISADELRGAIQLHTERNAVRHLLRVAAGLESPIIGEDQILGQVRNAFLDAERTNTAGPILSALFRTAIRAGRRARTETEIGCRAQSYARFAQHEVMGHIGRSARILLLGSGALARDLAAALHGERIQFTVVAGRHLSRATELATAYNADAAHFSRLASLLPEADAVIACTRTTSPIITAHILADREKSLLIVDLGMPRNVTEEVGEHGSTRLVTLADLVGGDPLPVAVTQAVEVILDQEMARFDRWRSARQVHLVRQRATEHIPGGRTSAPGNTPFVKHREESCR